MSSGSGVLVRHAGDAIDRGLRGMVLVVACLAASIAGAQSWPTRPVKLVVPMPPAGTTDNMGRLAAQKLSEILGQTVIVENRAGANGNIGSDYVAKSAPDGYTLLVSGVGSQGINATLYRNMSYDIVEGLTHIAMISKGPNTLVVNPAFPAHTLAELLALARKQPGKYNYASTGSGASNHLSMELLKSAARVYITHIPYRGGAPAMLDVMSGQVPMMFINFDSALPHVKSGKMRAIAVTSLTRRATLPEAPTVAESGFPGFEAESWTGISGPPHMPTDVVEKINAAMLRVVQLPDVKERFAGLGLDAAPGTPAQMKAFVKNEVEKWGKAVRASGATVD